MRTQAAILVEVDRVVVDEIDLPPLRSGQVLIEIKFSGVCHTQLLEVRGHRGHDPYCPHCLGHEGSGVVLEVGPQVKKVKPGDFVTLSWMKGTGANVPGSVYTWKEQNLNAGAITTFSRHSILSENRLTLLSPGFPLKEAALIGCMIPTGLGVLFNTVQPKIGESLAVFGCGGIGLTVLLGAKILGCTPRIAIDLNAKKLAIAKEAGATHCIDASNEDVLVALQKIGSLDYAIEASGSPIAMGQAFKAVRSQGGAAIIVGNARSGQQLSIDPKELNQGKRLLGTWGGDNQPDLHFPRYCELVYKRQLSLSLFTNHVYGLAQINDALAHLETGQVIRPLIDMSL